MGSGAIVQVESAYLISGYCFVAFTFLAIASSMSSRSSIRRQALIYCVSRKGLFLFIFSFDVFVGTRGLSMIAIILTTIPSSFVTASSNREADNVRLFLSPVH